MDEDWTFTERMKAAKAIVIAERCAGYDGAHHKQWTIDQMLRVLLGAEYDEWVATYNSVDGREWDVGIAP